MDSNFNITLDEALKAIEDYPYLRQCFSDYLKWLLEECDKDRVTHDILYFKIATDSEGLGELENVFREFGNTLSKNEADFYEAFRLDEKEARDKKNIMKLGDLLAEPWVALALQNIGFNTIKKVSLDSVHQKSFSDFTANWKSTKFAIEVKNARNADDEEFTKKRIDAHYKNEIVFTSELRARNGKDLSQQEEEILPNRLERRISTEKERNKITNQLKNTSEAENCDATMLVIYLEMMSGLMEESWIVHYLQKAKTKYSVLDYFACCINGTLICAPQLP